MIYDLSPPISSRLQVWPGDTQPEREILCDISKGDSITLSTLHATVHLGAHADGPNHYAADAPAIDERSLHYYLGPCQVVRLRIGRGQCVLPAHVTEKIAAPRVLFATETFPDPEVFNKDFAALSPELIDLLHAAGVILVGVDTPSVDRFESKDLPVHHSIQTCDMAILEGLMLREVPAGVYELIALPLRLVGFDASPVRAILRSIGDR